MKNIRVLFLFWDNITILNIGQYGQHIDRYIGFGLNQYHTIKKFGHIRLSQYWPICINPLWSMLHLFDFCVLCGLGPTFEHKPNLPQKGKSNLSLLQTQQPLEREREKRERERDVGYGRGRRERKTHIDPLLLEIRLQNYKYDFFQVFGTITFFPIYSSLVLLLLLLVFWPHVVYVVGAAASPFLVLPPLLILLLLIQFFFCYCCSSSSSIDVTTTSLSILPPHIVVGYCSMWRLWRERNAAANLVIPGLIEFI